MCNVRVYDNNVCVCVRQVTLLTKRVEQLRAELEKRSDEQEDSVAELKRRYDREKAILLEDNKKVTAEVERVRYSFSTVLLMNWTR